MCGLLGFIPVCFLFIMIVNFGVKFASRWREKCNRQIMAKIKIPI